MRRHSWERISQLFKISSSIPEISLWKQMFDITANWWANKKRSVTWTTLIWKKNSWKQLSLIGDETVYQSSAHKSLCFLGFCVVLRENPSTSDSKEAWKNRIAGVMAEKSYRDYDGINKERTEFRVEHFPRIHHVAALRWSHRSIQQIRRNTRKFHRKNSIHFDVQRHPLWNERQWKRMLGKCWSRLYICKEVWYWTVVTFWSRCREEMAFYGRE